LDLERPALALERFHQVIQEAPDLVEAFQFAGLAGLRSGDYVLAAVALRRAADLNPQSKGLALALGLVCQKLDLDKKAVIWLERALSAVAHHHRVQELLVTSLVRLGRFDRAAEVLEMSIDEDGKEKRAEDHFQVGLKLLLCEKPQAAVKQITRALTQGLRTPDVFLALGQALLAADRIDLALESLSVAVRMKPLAPEVHFFFGLAFQQAGDVDSALRELKIAVALDPKRTELKVILMGVQMRAGRYLACADLGRQVTAERPGMLAVRFDTAFCDALTGDLQRTIESMEDALDHDVAGSEVHTLWRRVDYLVEQKADFPGAYLLLAMIHERRGNWNKAVHAYQSFVRMGAKAPWIDIDKALSRIRQLSKGF
jgi:tetratricopeptide (TPR) repeat protein